MVECHFKIFSRKSFEVKGIAHSWERSPAFHKNLNNLPSQHQTDTPKSTYFSYRNDYRLTKVKFLPSLLCTGNSQGDLTSPRYRTVLAFLFSFFFLIIRLLGSGPLNPDVCGPCLMLYKGFLKSSLFFVFLELQLSSIRAQICSQSYHTTARRNSKKINRFSMSCCSDKSL